LIAIKERLGCCEMARLIQIKAKRLPPILIFRKREERMRKVVLVACFGFGAIAAPALAEGSGNALRGKAYAQSMCSSCHSVEKDGAASPNPSAKPFATISWDFSTSESLASFLNTRHPPFPISLVSERQAEDILSYVAAFRKEGR
jgi:mono/diheme cytochrome c family protein